MPSIGELNARVTANASQFIAEMSRADNETRRRAASIDKELGSLARNIERKFSLSEIGKDVLRFTGFGSGFAVAETAIGAITNHFREQEQISRDIEDIWKRIGERSVTFARQQMSPQERTDDILGEVAKLGERRATIERSIEEVRQLFISSGSPVPGDSTFSKQRLEIAQLTDQIQALSLEIVKLGNDASTESGKSFTKRLQNAVFGPADEIEDQLRSFSQKVEDGIKLREEIDQALAQQHRGISESFDALAKKGAAETRRLDSMAEAYRRMIDPLHDYKKALRDIAEIESKGVFTASESAKARAAELEKHLAPLNEISEGVFDRTKEKASEFSREMAMMWNDVSDRAGEAFADILIDGENTFKQLPVIVARAVAEMAARMAVINPILNGLFGLTGTKMELPAIWNFGGPRAAGGSVNSGSFYRVNERGTELLTVGGSDYLMMGANSGRVTPAGQSRPGNTYYVSIDARGAEAGVEERIYSVLSAALAPGVIERRAIAAVADWSQRRP